jgi:hypothetical protein
MTTDPALYRPAALPRRRAPRRLALAAMIRAALPGARARADLERRALYAGGCALAAIARNRPDLAAAGASLAAHYAAAALRGRA